MTIEWPKAGIIAQRHKYTYYSHFFTVTDHVLSKKYTSNDITCISINKKTLLAEITHLWLYDSTTGYARLKLYSLPDDLPHGRTHHHGEHELLLFYKPVIMTCKHLLSIEQIETPWSLGVPLQPPPHVSPPPSPPLSSPPSPPQSSSSSTELLYCNETMVPIGGFHDGTNVSPASSPVISRCPNSIDSSYKITIFSFAAYCRYRAVIKRFQPDPYVYMSYPLVQALGGVSVPTTPTIALFCRKTFRDLSLERRLMTSESPSIMTDLKQLPNHVYSFSGLSDNGELPLKRKRGRPRKNEPLLPPPPPNQGKKRGPGRPRRHPLPEKKAKVSGTDESPESSISASSSTSANIVSSQSSMSVQYNNNSNSSEMSTNEANSDASDLSPNEDSSRSLRPRESILPPPQFRDDSIYDTKLNFVDPPVVKRQPPAPVLSPPPPPPPSSTSLVPSAPPPPPPPPPPKRETPTINSIPERKDTCTLINNYIKTQTSQVPSSLPPPPSLPPPILPHPTPPPSPALTITPDVRQLLRAHLLKAQHDGQSQAVLKDLDEHLLEEKPFLDLLFCFMRLRNTPIHKIPRLGSKYLNLYSLFHSTTRMGGYDQVTVNRKWSSVFDSMGYSTTMTCASTVTRKHYEKLLLPFEKALSAMRLAAAQRAQ